MNLFDKQFVHILWDDTLLDKPCFYADSIGALIKIVNNNMLNYKSILIKSSGCIDFPFRVLNDNTVYRFAYYDPNYEFKCAYNAGKAIQYMDSNGYWQDCVPNWNTKDKYRVKPDKCYVGINKQKKLTWDVNPATYKHVYASFDSELDACKWIDEHKKFVPVMRAFEKGLSIEYKVKGGVWTKASTPSWDLRYRYRVKPDYEIHSCIDCKYCKYCNTAPLRGPCANCYSIHSDGDHDGFIQRKRKRMTNRQLAKWLADGNGQKIEGKNKFVYTTYAYKDGDSTPCRKGVLIRGWNETEWHEPEVE